MKCLDQRCSRPWSRWISRIWTRYRHIVQTRCSCCGREKGPYFSLERWLSKPLHFRPTSQFSHCLIMGLARTPQNQIDNFISTHTNDRLSSLEHRFLLSDIRLGTRQLRVWNSVSDGLTVSEQLNRLTALPGIDSTYASRHSDDASVRFSAFDIGDGRGLAFRHHFRVVVWR